MPFIQQYLTVLHRVPRRGLLLEFGVASGRSIRDIALVLFPLTVYGFDWFKGLPEELADSRGNVASPKGAYAHGRPTNLPSNVVIVEGLFQDTLKPFRAEHPEPVAYVHMDADLYSSTRYVLGELKDRLDGAFITFD